MILAKPRETLVGTVGFPDGFGMLYMMSTVQQSYRLFGG